MGCSRTYIVVALTGLTFITYVVVDRSANFRSDGILQKIKPTSRYSLEQMKEFAYKNVILTNYKPAHYTRWNLSFNRILDNSAYQFDINKDDVLVFLHIQKTAGTSFERFLVRHLNISQPCSCIRSKKRCECTRPNGKKGIWLFSRYSTGWICGLHADFTEMYVSGCVDSALDKKEAVRRKRRYFYTTFLREPISRFISEYRHVKRGATWSAARHICNGRPASAHQLPLCFDPDVGWDDVSMDEFLACDYNQAFNRQTRMLADLTLINCYDSSQMDPAVRDKIMLESAKANLRNFAFFGLKERMSESQWMFEELFQMRFTKNLADWNKSKSNDTEITHHQLELIKKKNSLDVELYDFARKLFSKRLKRLKNERGNKFGNIVNSASIDMHDKVSQVGMPTVRLRDDPVVKENFSQSFTAGWLERVQGTADLKSTKNNEKLDSTSFFNREQQPQNYERVDPGSVDNSDEADSTDDNESFFPVRTSGTSRLQLFKF